MTDKQKVPEFEDEDNNPFHAGLDDANGKDDESLLLYNNSVTARDTFNSVNYETRVSKVLRPSSNLKIAITEANNSSEGNTNASKKYIVYTIKLVNEDNAKEELQIRRRYSDFESLREALTRNFPLLIIPPIPPKNYLNFSVFNGIVAARGSPNTSKKESSAYSYINSTHLNSSRLIEHRKRLLTNFLNNCLKIPQIRNLEFFAKFLDPNANWSDEISLFNSQLPKDIYHSNPENGLKTDPAYAHLPNPAGSTMAFLKPIADNSRKLGKKTNKLLNGTESSEPPEIQEDTARAYIINTSPLDEINKKIMDNFIGLANDYTELGTVFNSSSLLLAEAPIMRAKSKEVQDDQSAKLNIILDKMGQVFERSYITINLLINDLETKFSEPLGEAVQYSAILEFIQKFQQRKLRQQTMLDAEVKEKQKTLQDLLKAEEEASKIENGIKNDSIAKNNNYKLNEPTNDKTASSSKFNLFSIKKLSAYVSGIIDQNPEETRKQKIAALQAKITTLEKCQGIMLEDVACIANEVDKNFKQFHNRQLKVIYDILLHYNGFLIGWAKKNLDIWEEIRDEIVKL